MVDNHCILLCHSEELPKNSVCLNLKRIDSEKGNWLGMFFKLMSVYFNSSSESLGHIYHEPLKNERSTLLLAFLINNLERF